MLISAVFLVLKAPDAIRRAAYPLRYEQVIRQSSKEYGLQPTFVAAVIRTESRFNPDARSSQGAYGLMQVLPRTARFISERSGIQGNYRDPQVNIRMGAWYLSYLQGRYSGDETLMLAAYNSGEGRVDGWLAEGRNLRQGIPFKETHEYVKNVLAAQKTYEELYGRNLDRNNK
ncbi:MAG: lytic transglycosylase domain-containing protein [Rubrobacteraceae bacterium]